MENNPEGRSILDWARFYSSLGWSVIPILPQGKKPALNTWIEYQNRRATDEELQAWFAPGKNNIGVVTGAISGIFVLDGDGEEGVERLERLDQRGLPETIRSFTARGEHRLFQHPGGGVRISNRTGVEPGLDVRGDGGYIVVAPSIHPSGHRYCWDVDLHPEDITVSRPPDALIAYLADKATERPTSQESRAVPQAGPFGIDQMVLADGRERYMRDTILAVCNGLRKRLGRLPSEAELQSEAWPQYASRVDLTRPGRGLDEFNRKVAYTLRRAEAGQIKGFKDAPAPAGAGADDQELAPVVQAPSIEIDWASDFVEIPVRPWIAKNFLMRGAVSVLAGPGSGGKSSFVVGASMALAAGIPYGNFIPEEPCVSINYNVEDDRDEQRRRYLAAILANPQFTRQHLAQVGRACSGTIGTLFVRDGGTGEVKPTAAMDTLEQAIVESGASVLFVDPLAELHDVDENDNTGMRAVVATFRTVAKRLNIAVLILHHNRKGTGVPGDMDQMRGASSIVGAVRVGLTLTRMSEQEAESLEIDPDARKSYFRVDDGKQNYGPQGEPQWYHLKGYQIVNGEMVAAATPWAPPKPLDGVTRADMIKILEAIKAVPADERRKDQRSTGWAGNVAMQQTGLSEQKVSAAITALTESGALVVEDFKDARSRDKKALAVNETIFLQIKRDGQIRTNIVEGEEASGA